MSTKILLIIIALIILFLLPRIIQRVVYKKLTNYLSTQQYDQFESLLDGFWCTFSFQPFNREYMRLTSYFMQNDAQKISKQLNNLFENIKLNDQQEVAIANRAFYFYLEQKNNPKAKEMLEKCKQKDENHNEVDTMEIMYSIIGEKKSEHIKDIQSRLAILQKESDAYTNHTKIIKIGVFEYMIGLQYSYLHNKKESKKYLESALKHCKNTPYESQIQALL